MRSFASRSQVCRRCVRHAAMPHVQKGPFADALSFDNKLFFINKLYLLS
jgi:hypothetical protein